MLKSSVILFCFNLNITFWFAYRRTLKLLISTIPGLLNGSFHPETIILSLETPGYLKTQENSPNRFKTYYFCKSQNFGTPQFWQFSKRRAPTNDEDLSNKFSDILDMRSISIKDHVMDILWHGPNIFRKH